MLNFNPPKVMVEYCHQTTHSDKAGALHYIELLKDVYGYTNKPSAANANDYTYPDEIGRQVFVSYGENDRKELALFKVHTSVFNL